MCMGSNPSYWLWSTVGRTCTQVWSTLIFSIAVFWKGDWLGLFKTQLIHFSHSLSSSCSACIYFCDHLLPFLDTISHLGHLLHYDLNDTEDVNSKLRDMVRKANCLLANFPRVGPFILTHLFQSYTVCLFMALASGHSHALLFRTLKLPSIRFYIEPGVFLPAVIPALFT